MSSVCLFLVAGIFYFYYKYGFQSTRQIKTLALISSAACTVIALLGRYSKEDNLYYGIRMEDFQNSPVQQGLLTAFIAAGLLLFFYFCFQRLYECAGRFTILRTKAPPMENWAVFLCCFLIIFICWLPYFLAYFPGILSNDSVWQMDQILGIRPAEQPPSLHAHHDYQAVLFHRLRNFWHGKRWNRHLYVIPDDNDGPHLLLPDSYGLPQAKTGWCIGLLAYFALVPFHAMYSLTMWKDILLGGVVLLFAISLRKTFKSIPQRRVHLACAAHVLPSQGF